MLLRAESVRRELGLSVEQTTAVARIVEGAELPLWRLRDLPAQERDESAGPVLQELRTRLRDALPGRQFDRLDQLALQARGIQAVFEPRVADVLKLTSGQQERIWAVLGSPVRKTNPAEAEHNALAVLNLAQRHVLASLLGPPFDLARVPQIACKVPELEGVAEWINSPSVTLEQLQGKVVVVHYYAFGCINCIRNLPHYNGWFDRFGRDDVAIIGIHRPETEAERDIENVRRKVAEAGIKYPVAVDNESRNWDAWVNRVWPSVYLIDKRGFVRYWWYGELNWQDAKGEVWMRARIAELTAE
jgi:peroxiredoxin